MKIKEALKRFWEKYISDVFPYPDACWDCNRGDCNGCEILKDIPRIVRR